MPSKKRKYNARFPAGRIKKIMQTDEEVGKVAQAVPIIISMLSTTPRTLELFVESLLKKAVQVTVSRNAKTLSPSHVKQCILGESRFDFLRDLVKNIPDVSVAEEKELMSAESSPNSSRFSDMSVQRRVARIDSNSSSGSEVRLPGSQPLPETEPPRPRPEVTATIVSAEAMDLTKRKDDDKPRKANFYQETLLEKAQHRTVIQVNPTYASPQPSTSSYANMTPVEPTQRVDTPKQKPLFFIDVNPNSLTKLNAPHVMLTTPGTPVTPLINIDFSKNLANPEIKVLDTSVAGIVGVKDKATQKVHRQNSKPKADIKRDVRPVQSRLDIDHINSGNLQIDEDYDNARRRRTGQRRLLPNGQERSFCPADKMSIVCAGPTGTSGHFCTEDKMSIV